MSSNTAMASRPLRGGAPARLLRAVLTGLSDRAHATGDAQARAMGWAVTTMPGPLGLGGRAYRHTGFGPGTADRRSEHSREPERGPRYPRPVGEAQPSGARPEPRVGRQDCGDA
jgi:hypothetical protein